MIRCSASISIQEDSIFSPFSVKDWRSGFKWVSDSGFEAVEIILSNPNLVSADEILAEANNLGISISTISTGQANRLEGLEMVSPSEVTRELTLRRLMDFVDFSTTLGNPNVTLGLIRGVCGKQDQQIEYDLLRRELEKISNYAYKKNIKLNLEPINRYETALINSTLDGAKLLDDIGRPENVGILYDTFHSNIEDPNMISTIISFGQYFSHVHIADSNRCLPGDGHIDFKSLVSALIRTEFTGYASLEVISLPDRSQIIEHAGDRLTGIISVCHE